MRALLFTMLAACAAAPPPVVVAPVVPPAPAPVVDPPRERHVITDTTIEVYDTILFVGNTAEITASSSNILDAIAATLRGNPSILLLQIRGHSDWEEPDRVRRAELSVQRAENVVAALIARGVEPARLVAYGASDSEPISRTDPMINRRIELLILERD